MLSRVLVLTLIHDLTLTPAPFCLFKADCRAAALSIELVSEAASTRAESGQIAPVVFRASPRENSG
jgi:hypothetical protein